MDNKNQQTKKILGLDLGTNSIGWALVEIDNNLSDGKIVAMGSRIIPMGEELSKFERGQAQTKNANRRIARGIRKLNKRYKQRRNKLLYVLDQLEMMPEQITLSDSFIDPLKIDKVSILPINKSQKQYTATELLELRVKALNEKISLQELGKIIYLFNQLRGYSGGGNEPDKENDNDNDNDDSQKKGKESFNTFGKIIELSEPEFIKYKGKNLTKRRIKIETDNGIIEGDTLLDILKINESLEFLVNITQSKSNGETITFKLPIKTNWRKKMENIEKELTGLQYLHGRQIHISEYFLSILKENKWAKIKDNVILRSRYQSEFDAIWKEQCKHHEILSDTPVELLKQITSFIFPGNSHTQEKLKNEGLEKGLFHIIKNQIIYYQRELKDQGDLISNCRFEPSEKVIAKSHPIFQEFKIWEQINKLTVNTKIETGVGKKGQIKYSYIDKPLPSKLKEWLYTELQSKKEIGFSVIYNKLKKEYGIKDGTDFLNGMNPKAKIKGNDTKILLKKAIGESIWEQLNLDDKDNQIKLWDILYNAKGNEYELDSDRTSKVLSLIQEKRIDSNNLYQTAIEISKIKFSRDYASLSLKAINKILPLVRCGRYFDENFSSTVKDVIIKLLNENLSDPFEKAAQEYLENNIELLNDGGLMNAYATMLVYGRHTGGNNEVEKIINTYHEIQRLPQGDLRNPLVEQIINETLMVVKDIWRYYGKPNEIRLELARELKNNAERRSKIYKNNIDNQKANEEIKNLLIELKQEVSIANIEKYKLWLNQENQSDELIKIYRDPSKTEIEKLRLWREQGHLSPYTGQPIPLSELFNKERFDVDHIIPQSRYFDDSLTNKVVCEKAVNKEKGNRTAMEYFEVGSSIPSVFSKNIFINHVNQRFQGLKRKNLLATKIPEDPISRQIKDTQYISVRIKDELKKIVGVNNVKTSTGGVTDYLRNQWGLTDKFKKILIDRYENSKQFIAELEYEKRKELISDKETFIESLKKTIIERKNNKLIIKGWSKRIDHRHHAMDALVVACTDPKHIKRLNDLNKELQTWLDQNKKIFFPEFNGTPTELLDEILQLDETNRDLIFRQIKKFRNFNLPWNGFPETAERAIREIIVSHKPKEKLLIQKSSNDKYQIKIRGQLHEGTLYGKSQGVETYRIPLTKLGGKKFATEKTIDKIVNKDLKEIIKNHLSEFGSKEDAFSVEGILTLNKRLATKRDSNGKIAPHTPIKSIKIFYRDPFKIKLKKGQEEIDDALQKLDRKKSFNNSLYVKTGDNYLFAVLEKNGKRLFEIITFFDAANLLKEEFNKLRDKNNFNKEKIFKNYFEKKCNAKLLFTLKQGDPVYMPKIDEEVITDPASPMYKDFWSNKVDRSQNIHYVTKFSGQEIYFIKHNIAEPIVKGKEFGSQNAYQNIFGMSIKQKCIKISIDRLGIINFL